MDTCMQHEIPQFTCKDDQCQDSYSQRRAKSFQRIWTAMGIDSAELLCVVEIP